MTLKGDKYETAEEVKFRLENTVVLYDKEPVYITKVNLPEPEDGKGEIARVFFQPLPYPDVGGRFGETRKYLSSKNFDLTPFKMGYVNIEGSAYFLSRNPVRQNRQGLANNNISIKDFRGRGTDKLKFGSLIRSTGFIDMFHGKYPTFKQISDLLDYNVRDSVAIGRSFALGIDQDLEAMVLYHKGVKCGLALTEDKAVRVPEKFHFLREEMEEQRIPIA